MELKSNRPYLVRGIYDWIVDNQLTPYMLVDVTKRKDDISVAMHYVDNGRIVLNIGPSAVSHMLFNDDNLSFNARFNGQSFPVVIPFAAILAIYAKEIGQGMLFNDRYASTINTMNKQYSQHQSSFSSKRNTSKKHSKPFLTLVK